MAPDMGEPPAPAVPPDAVRSKDRFDRLCRIAAAQLNLPIAALTLVDAGSVRLHSAVGLPTLSIPRQDSFCGVVVARLAPLVVADASADPRFAHTPLVAGPTGIRYYVGVPVHDRAGQAIGTLCGLDTVPHLAGASAQDLAMLADLADLAGIWLDQDARATQLTQRQASLERHHRAVFEGLPLPLISIDRNGIVTAWNPAAERVFGWTAAEAIGCFGPHVPVAEQAAARALQALVLRGDQLLGVEVERQRRDGSRLPVAIVSAVLRDAAGQIDGAVLVLEDITERRRAAAEAAARVQRIESQSRLLTGIAGAMPAAAADLPGALQRIAAAAVEGLDGIDAGVWRLAAEGTALQLMALVGSDGQPVPASTAKHAALRSLPCGPVLSAALQAGRQVAAGDARTDPRVAELLQPYVQPFGIGALLSAPVRVGAELLGLISACHHGEARAWSMEEQSFLASLSDLAALAFEAARRAEANERLAEAVARTQAASQAKSQFLGAVSREVRTPLHAIIGFAELLDSAELPAARRGEYAGHIASAGRQLLAVFNDVLEQAQLDATPPPLAAERIDLARLLDQAALAAAPDAAARGIIIGLEIAALPPLQGDAARLRQGLDRLLAHAIRVSPGGARVALGAEFNPADGFRLRVDHAGPAEGPQAFDAFGAPAVLARASGLGLPLARAVVEAHGGRIAALALDGRRQRLLVSLPAWRALSPAAASPAKG